MARVKNVKKILFIAPFYPGRSPSQRFRFEQYLEYLSENNFECKVSFLITPKSDTFFYKEGNYFRKLLLLIRFTFVRIRDVISANRFDIIFIQREAFFLGTSVFEYLLSKSKAKLVYDFDDSIWLENVSSANKTLNWLKDQSKTARIVKYADLVFAGNEFLANYARAYNNNVVIIPTTVVTENKCTSKEKRETKKICIGWSGSLTTIKHFELAIPFLLRVKKKYGDKVTIKVIGDGYYINDDLDIKGVSWAKETEISELRELDIGIMPLPDSPWAKGKCGLKGLLYMSLGIPTIMSPVGVNCQIIRHGINGFLAKSDDEWVANISELIESQELRLRIGNQGYETVKQHYSVEAYKNIYLKHLNNICGD